MSDKNFKSWLTSKVERREIGQGDKGMYAVQPIAKDERIWGFFNPLLPPEKSSACCQSYPTYFDQVVSQLVYAYLTLDELGGESFTHSCDPNAGFRGTLELVAMHPISPDERITFDYAMCLPFTFGQMTCRCGAVTCRKVVTGNDWELPELQQRYQGYFQPFIEEKITQVKNRGELHAIL
jgi:hypothetical protein